MSSKNLFFNCLDTIELDKIVVDELGNIKYDNKKVFVKGPRMSMGSDIIKSGDYFYIDLVFDLKNQNNVGLYKLIKNIDGYAISEVFENPAYWYNNEAGTGYLTQIEHDFIQTIKKSTIYDGRRSLKLKIPISEVEIYDQDNIIVPYQLVKEHFKAIPLLGLSCISKGSDGHLWVDWKLPQIKVFIPETLIKGCQLIDIEDDSDEETLPDS